jgi:hypothetical protein
VLNAVSTAISKVESLAESALLTGRSSIEVTPEDFQEIARVRGSR